MKPRPSPGRLLAIASIAVAVIAFCACVVQITCFRVPKHSFAIVAVGQPTPPKPNQWAEDYIATPARWSILLAVGMAIVSFFGNPEGRGLSCGVLLVNFVLLLGAWELYFEQMPSL